MDCQKGLEHDLREVQLVLTGRGIEAWKAMVVRLKAALGRVEEKKVLLGKVTDRNGNMLRIT